MHETRKMSRTGFVILLCGVKLGSPKGGRGGPPKRPPPPGFHFLAGSGILAGPKKSPVKKSGPE